MGRDHRLSRGYRSLRDWQRHPARAGGGHPRRPAAGDRRGHGHRGGYPQRRHRVLRDLQPVETHAGDGGPYRRRVRARSGGEHA